MKHSSLIKIILVLLFIYLIGCEKIIIFENSKFNAEVVRFVSEKCYCCWGWEIKIGDQLIKADSLPDVSIIGYTISKPIPVIIEIGKKKTDCTNKPDYYEIKSLTIK